jgi:hypothetical protein
MVQEQAQHLPAGVSAGSGDGDLDNHAHDHTR